MLRHALTLRQSGSRCAGAICVGNQLAKILLLLKQPGKAFSLGVGGTILRRWVVDRSHVSHLFIVVARLELCHCLFVLQAVADGQTFPTITANKAEVIDAVVSWVHEAIAQDRKVGALKQLQGHVWRSGFKKGQLTAELFRWVCSATVCCACWTWMFLYVL